MAQLFQVLFTTHLCWNHAKNCSFTVAFMHHAFSLNKETRSYSSPSSSQQSSHNCPLFVIISSLFIMLNLFLRVLYFLQLFCVISSSVSPSFKTYISYASVFSFCFVSLIFFSFRLVIYIFSSTC